MHTSASGFWLPFRETRALFRRGRNRHCRLGDYVAVETGLSLAPERDCASGNGVEGVVFADADIRTWFNSGASLAHQYLTGLDRLSVSALHTQELRLGVAKVF